MKYMDNFAQKVLDETKKSGSLLRRQDMQKRLDYYNDKQLEYLNEAIKDQFSFPDRLKLQKEIYNITSILINEIAILYAEKPSRTVKSTINGEEVENESDTELYEDILEYSNLDGLMQQVNRMAKLMKVCLVRPVWCEDEQTVRYVVYTPNMFDVIKDPLNPTKPQAIIYSSSYQTADEKFYNNDDTYTKKDQFELQNTIFHVWTDLNYYIFSLNWDAKLKDFQLLLMDNPMNPDNINPYGTLDIFVPIKDGYAFDDFFPEGGQDIIETNELLNIKLTELNYLIKMQSFSIPVRKGAEKADPIILDPSMTIDIPADNDMGRSDFFFASPDAKISEVQSEIDQKVRRLALKYKVNPQMFTSSGNISSAESMQMQFFKQGQLIQSDKPVYRMFEQKLFEMTKLVNNLHNTKQFTDCDLMIDFRDIEVPKTQDQEDQHNLLLLNNGLITKAEWLVKENPDLTIEEATEKIIENEGKVPPSDDMPEPTDKIVKPMMTNESESTQVEDQVS